MRSRFDAFEDGQAMSDPDDTSTHGYSGADKIAIAVGPLAGQSSCLDLAHLSRY
ncbi:MAG: hypothetical protein R2865_10745 [Deinococcales bacterium]